MKLSVITVSFNSAATIRWTIESFLEQTHTDAELLVVDGASRDDTVEIVSAYGDPRIRLLSERDKGIFDAMNKGLRLFEGDAVGFLNSDDRYHDREALAAIAEALSVSDIAYADIDIVENHTTRRLVRAWRNTAWRKGAFRGGWMPAHPGFYVRRRVAEAVGPFDMEFPNASDYDWMLRAMELFEFSAGHVDRVVVDMAAGGNSSSGLKAYMRGNMESLRVRRKRLNAGVIDAAFVMKPLRKLPQWLTRG